MFFFSASGYLSKTNSKKYCPFIPFNYIVLFHCLMIQNKLEPSCQANILKLLTIRIFLACLDKLRNIYKQVQLKIRML